MPTTRRHHQLPTDHHRTATFITQPGHHTPTPREIRANDAKPKNYRELSTKPLGNNQETPSSVAWREATPAKLSTTLFTGSFSLLDELLYTNPTLKNDKQLFWLIT